ncbi:MAG: hypothetical protein ABI342_09245 [Nitrososphaera sp.]
MLTKENNKTIPYSFRIDNEVYLELESEARKKSVSINSLLNQVTKDYFFKKNFEKLACIPVPLDILRDVFDSADENILAKKADKLGSNHAIEYVQSLYHDMTKATAIKFLDVWFGRFSKFEHEIHGSTHSYSVQHDINEKYSVFMKEFVKSFCETILRVPVKIQATQRMITFSFSS